MNLMSSDTVATMISKTGVPLQQFNHQSQKFTNMRIGTSKLMERKDLLDKNNALEFNKDKADRYCVGKNVNSTRYKTELCRPFQETNNCKYGEKCQFAHGLEELRGMQRHPKYKTELCRTYHAQGFCPYGPRCHFIHHSTDSSAELAQIHNQMNTSFFGFSPICDSSSESSTGCISGSQSPTNSSPSSRLSPTNFVHFWPDESEIRSNDAYSFLNCVTDSTLANDLEASLKLDEIANCLKQNSSLLQVTGLMTPSCSGIICDHHESNGKRQRLPIFTRLSSSS